jgi:TRAP-type C4-dicarboxylate transport system permease small subunit
MTGRETASGQIGRMLDRIHRALAPFIDPFRDDEGAPSGIIDRLDRMIDALLYILSALLLIAISAVVTYSIFMRYALNRPPIWSEGVPMVFFVWMTFLALAVATRRGENIRVTFFIEKLSPLARLALELFMHALVIAMMAVIFWYSFEIIRLQLRGTMLSTGWNLAVIWIPLPLGMVLMTLYQIKRIRWTVRTYRLAVGAKAEGA